MSIQDDKHLDRLVVISRIMLDTRVIALRKENEFLHLKLFWKDHSNSKLKEWMQVANQIVTKCVCLSCAVSGRVNEEMGPAKPWGSLCIFKPWFEQLLTECSLVSVTGVGIGMEPKGEHMSCDCENSVYDVDAHLHHLTRDDWVTWMYGAKLWKATSVNNPELIKVKQLFSLLQAAVDGAGD
ncbi:MAG: hypothetical protein WCO49_20035 [Nostocales cyanobacterium ELA608]